VMHGRENPRRKVRFSLRPVSAVVKLGQDSEVDRIVNIMGWARRCLRGNCHRIVRTAAPDELFIKCPYVYRSAAVTYN
jgi:hypothetical protein